MRLTLLILIGILFIGGCVQTYEYQYNQTKQELEQAQEQIKELQQEIDNIENFNKHYSKALIELSYADFDRINGDYNYDLWSWYYQQGYFFDSIDYCVSARQLYTSSNSHYQNAISYFEQANKTAKDNYKELIDHYIKAADIAIDINWAMYEACEYFESACNYYYQYNLEGDDALYELGTSELETGNEKILKHDSLVKTYNSYLSKIEVLEENI